MQSPAAPLADGSQQSIKALHAQEPVRERNTLLPMLANLEKRVRPLLIRTWQYGNNVTPSIL